MDDGDELAEIANAERQRDRQERDSVAEASRVVTGMEADGNDDAKLAGLGLDAVELAVAANGRGDNGERDIVDGGAAKLLDGLDVGQRDLGPIEFLRSAADDVEGQPLDRCSKAEAHAREVVE